MSETTTGTARSSTAPVIGPDQIALLERLCNASGVSGDEGEVRKIVLEQVRGLADEVRIDSMGSVLAIKHARSSDNPLRIMLDAHMDEVGFMITADEDDGLYRFAKIGGIDDRVLPGKVVLVGKDHIPGVIGAKPIHLTEPGETENKISLEGLRIDIGPGGGKIRPGDRATFATRFKEVGPSFMAKALDNRLGCAALIEILRSADGLPDHIELLLSWSVQEEIGLRGARVAAYALDPELAIAIDSTPAYDLPVFDEETNVERLENDRYNTRLGLGPALYLADSSTLGDPRIARHLMQTGEALGIPYQIRQPGGGGTDGGAIHKARAGIPTLSVSVPGRYAHTAVSVARRADWENLIALVWNSVALMDRTILEGERG